MDSVVMEAMEKLEEALIRPLQPGQATVNICNIRRVCGCKLSFQYKPGEEEESSFRVRFSERVARACSECAKHGVVQTRKEWEAAGVKVHKLLPPYRTDNWKVGRSKRKTFYFSQWQVDNQEALVAEVKAQRKEEAEDELLRVNDPMTWSRKHPEKDFIPKGPQNQRPAMAGDLL